MAKQKQEETATVVVDVDQLLTELSKKNEEYVFKLRRILTDNGYSEDKQRDVLANLLPQMVDEQHKGKPATQLYGPVTEKANSIINAPKPVKKAPFWLSSIDLSLFFMAIFAAIYGLMIFFNANKSQAGTGLMSLAIMSIMAGVVFAYFNQWQTQPKDKRPRTVWVLLIGILVVLAGSFLSSALALIKSPLTQPTNWIAYAVVAVVTYGIHFWLKRQYHLPSVFTQQPAPSKK